MDALFRALQAYEVLIYVALGLVAWLTLQSILRAWKGYRAAVYKLEKEIAMRKLVSRSISLGLIVLLGVLEFALVSFVIPNLPANTFGMPEFPNFESILTPQAEEGNPQQTALPEVPLGSSGCIPGRLVISSPRSGQDINGRVEISGTADIPNFGFYKYEYSPLGSDIWTPISAGRSAVRDDLIGRWDTTEITPGDYSLRLVITDNTGSEQTPCIISVRVLAP
jgi:hypothetical protein